MRVQRLDLLRFPFDPGIFGAFPPFGQRIGDFRLFKIDLCVFGNISVVFDCLPSDPIGQIERKNNGGFLAKTEFKQ